MKKYAILFSLTLSAITALAGDQSDAYSRGYMFGKGLGMLLITALIVWGSWRFIKKKKQ
jgi:hypothetical protein